MVNYANGEIYKIVCDTTGLIYIGSTCERLLSRRLSAHTGDYRKWVKGNSKNYVTSFKIFENNNYHIELIEVYPCSIFDELTTREGWYQQNNECVNKNIAGRTKKEYYEDNKGKILEINKQYYEDNKVKINEYKKKYCEDHRVQIAGYNKQYRDDHRVEILKNKKKYYLKKKAKKLLLSQANV